MSRFTLFTVLFLATSNSLFAQAPPPPDKAPASKQDIALVLEAIKGVSADLKGLDNRVKKLEEAKEANAKRIQDLEVAQAKANKTATATNKRVTAVEKTTADQGKRLTAAEDTLKILSADMHLLKTAPPKTKAAYVKQYKVQPAVYIYFYEQVHTYVGEELHLYAGGRWVRVP